MANTFITLTDTPSVYTGSTGKFVQVSGIDTLIFNTIDTNQLSDVQTSGGYTPATGQVLTYTSSGVWRPVTNDPYSVSNGLDKTSGTISVVAGIDGGLTSNSTGLYITPISGVDGTYGNATLVPRITVNDKGQITAVTQVEGEFETARNLIANHIRDISGTSGQITVTGGSGVASNATINLVATGVTSDVYGSAAQIPQITVDSYGRIQNVDLIDVVGANLILGNGNVSLNDVTTEAYRNIVVEGQTTLSADNPRDSLNFAAGDGIEITTTASSDTITITAVNADANVANSNIGDLADVSTVGIVDGQALIWVAANSQFEPGTVAGGGGDGNVTLGSFSVATSNASSGGSLTYNGFTGVFTFSPADVTALISLADLSGNSGIQYDSNVGEFSLAATGVTSGVYGDAGNVAQITVDDFGRITSITEVAVEGGGDGTGIGTEAERFKINYASDGTLSTASDLTNGINSVVIDSNTGGEVTVTFSRSLYRFPPGAIMFYGYNYSNNKYIITPLDSTMTLREVAAGGTSGSPTLFDGEDTVEMRIRIRETETGASRGGFGTTTHAWVQFIMNG